MSLQLNGTDGVTFNDGSEQWAAASPIGTKNLIINGNMQIAQRGTSVSGITAVGYYTIDRWIMQLSSAGTWTMSQDTDVPTGQGFANSLKWQCTSSTATPIYNVFWYKVEGQMLQHLKKGTANAEPVTLSFWIKSNKTGTYQVNLQDVDNNRIIGATYTISSANTWEKTTITFEGDTTGAFDNNNAESLNIEWWFATNATYSGGAVPTSWETQSDNDRAAGLTVNISDSTSNYINITGVQLEVGDTATPFEVMPYDMNLARCQRYYQVSSASGRFYTSDGYWGLQYVHKVQMRATPTIGTISGGNNSLPATFQGIIVANTFQTGVQWSGAAGTYYTYGNLLPLSAEL